MLYIVQGKRPVREAVVERLETTHAMLESDPWQITSLKIWSWSLISTVKFSMARFPSKPAVQEIFTTLEPFVSTVMFCGGSGIAKELNNTSISTKVYNLLEGLSVFTKRGRLDWSTVFKVHIGSDPRYRRRIISASLLIISIKPLWMIFFPQEVYILVHGYLIILLDGEKNRS